MHLLVQKTGCTQTVFGKNMTFLLKVGSWSPKPNPFLPFPNDVSMQVWSESPIGFPNRADKAQILQSKGCGYLENSVKVTNL